MTQSETSNIRPEPDRDRSTSRLKLPARTIGEFFEIGLDDSVAGLQWRVIESARRQFVEWLAAGVLVAGVELEVRVGPARMSPETRELLAKADEVLARNGVDWPWDPR